MSIHFFNQTTTRVKKLINSNRWQFPRVSIGDKEGMIFAYFFALKNRKFYPIPNLCRCNKSSQNAQSCSTLGFKSWKGASSNIHYAEKYKKWVFFQGLEIELPFRLFSQNFQLNCLVLIAHNWSFNKTLRNLFLPFYKDTIFTAHWFAHISWQINVKGYYLSMHVRQKLVWIAFWINLF